MLVFVLKKCIKAKMNNIPAVNSPTNFTYRQHIKLVQY